MTTAARGPGRTAVWAIALVVAAVGVTAYVGVSAATFRTGFPLDDAWIHQTYARNLAARGEWAFVSGRVSGGSTAPLWTILLAAGRSVGVEARAWAYLLGALALGAGSVMAASCLRARTGLGEAWAAAAALTFVLEWHLVWAAASGMEVILVALVAVAVMRLCAGPSTRPGAAGLLAGLAIWIRPDAVSLGMIPLATVLLGRGPDLRQRISGLLRLAAALVLPILPYVLFNLGTSGAIWPSTFFAKQAEYAALRQLPLTVRLGQIGMAPLIGPGIALLPAVAVAGVAAVRRRDWPALAPLLWALVYLAVFALRLPVTYQHGRYQIPILPVLVVLGWEGIAAVGRLRGGVGRRLVVGWGMLVAGLTFGFGVLGARAYAQDVAVIESEMVDAARWIAEHTDPQALVAAHDIGALGYFGERDVLDLAGLADAEVIPILRDEPALAALLDERRAGYLMTFPGWYPALSACGVVVYASDAGFSPALGGENLRVYRWPSAGEDRPQGCMLYSP